MVVLLTLIWWGTDMSLANALIPPFSSSLIDNMGGLTPFWINWYNQIYQTLYRNISIAQGIPSQNTTALTQIVFNPGDIVFNSVTKKWNGWDGTSLVEFTTV